MKIYEILEELNVENGSNHKMDVLRKYADYDLLKRVLKMTYDKATFTYGVSMLHIEWEPETQPAMTFEKALNILEDEFVTRKVTGHAALARLGEVMSSLTKDGSEVIRKIINRDLRINMGRSNINKVFEGLIVKPVYMRCGIYTEKTAKNFNPFGAFVQLKADGSYREFLVDDDQVTCVSRQGEEYVYPEINEILRSSWLEGPHVYFGELTVYQNGVLLPRSEGNGILRKKAIPDDCVVIFDCWDVVALEEYKNAVNKIHGKTPYHVRWDMVSSLFPSHQADPIKNNVRAIECIGVRSIQEALRYTAQVMNRGLEGTIIKERDAIFRDGTNPSQLKLKLEIDVDVRVTGFKEGKPGTVREKTFGAMIFETDDEKIKGRTSGFSNSQLKDFNGRREELIGKIMTVTCNDITQGRDNDYHALSHPRFVEFRDDKTETDTLGRALEAKEMAMMVDQQSEVA